MTHICLYFIYIHCALRLISSPNFDFQNLISVLVILIFHPLCRAWTKSPLYCLVYWYYQYSTKLRAREQPSLTSAIDFTDIDARATERNGKFLGS